MACLVQMKNDAIHVKAIKLIVNMLSNYGKTCTSRLQMEPKSNNDLCRKENQ